MAQRRLEGGIALVTGGGAGIGKAIVLRFLQEGCKAVYVLDIIPEPNFDNAQEIRYNQVDICDMDSVLSILEDIKESEGKLDVLVNNAATFQYESADELTEKALEKSFEVNVKAPAMLIKHAVPLLKKSTVAAIINMSSINAIIAQPGFVPYAMSKAAVTQLTRTAATDLGKFDIRVNSILPGAIFTEATSRHADASGKTVEELVEELKQRHALPKMGRPEDIAAAVAFLASQDAAFITGSSLVVDGGYTLT